MPCGDFNSWKGYGLQTNECVEYWQGCCHEPMSPHNNQRCPWRGYPKGHLTIKTPMTSDQMLAVAVGLKDRGEEN